MSTNSQSPVTNSPGYIARVEFHDSFVKVQSPNEPMKAISWSDYIKVYDEGILSKKSEEAAKSTSEEICLMPMNVIATKDFFQKGELVRKDITMFFPEMVAPLSWGSSVVFNNFKWPNIIVTCGLRLNSKTNLWALDRTRFFTTDKRSEELDIKGPINDRSHSKHIWVLPLPNMHGDGSMCFGKNSIPTTYSRSDLRELTWLYVMTTTSAFNNDLSIPGIGTGRDGIPAFLKNVAEKCKTFPYWKLPDSPWGSEKEFYEARGITTAKKTKTK